MLYSTLHCFYSCCISLSSTLSNECYWHLEISTLNLENFAFLSVSLFHFLWHSTSCIFHCSLPLVGPLKEKITQGKDIVLPHKCWNLGEWFILIKYFKILLLRSKHMDEKSIVLFFFLVSFMISIQG